MKLLISVLLLGLMVTACKPVEDLDADKTPDKIINETDYSKCGDSTGAKNIIGNWYYQQGIGNTKFVKSYSISREYIRITNTCTFDGVPVNASATSRIVLSMNSISMLDSALNENVLQREGYKLTCQARVEPVDFHFSFKGNCLVMTSVDGKSSLALLPAAN
ncbi:hypothetical protein DOM22_18965 [Bdellovibrio sp. ZAP7]|uniref:hypothetical protein n=1 Tax=Bdellovibrio sp. ZAP7 TaxID=2231053 RepID=UPI001157FBA0|nr:hypothetical protein [Bdellovibrio sp. ZAP7]QDK47095.1 hypothetical protein DOM22_18965 [Bdellovibrio sp. ZAP7]